MTDYQIMEQLHRMLMYASICKANGNNDSDIAKFIINGFTGVLYGWWHNSLNLTQKEEILSATRIETEGNQSSVQEDSTYTLVATVVTHFLGNMPQREERGRELLQNLRCPSLTHFRWYKDVFLSKVMLRDDVNSSFWKAKFIDGLPPIFSEKVRQHLREQNDGFNIPYDFLTYGQITGACTQVGLNICNDMKLQHQLKKQNLTGKKEIGEFCQQFAYDLPTSCSKEKSKKFDISKYKKKGKQKFKKFSKEYYSKPKRNKNFFNKKKVVF